MLILAIDYRKHFTKGYGHTKDGKLIILVNPFDQTKIELTPQQFKEYTGQDSPTPKGFYRTGNYQISKELFQKILQEA